MRALDSLAQAGFRVGGRPHLESNKATRVAANPYTTSDSDRPIGWPVIDQSALGGAGNGGRVPLSAKIGFPGLR